MSDASPQPEFVVQYLLGELPDDEQSRYEEAYLTDDAVFAQLLAIEQELIDRYVCGALPASQRAHFESYFLRSRHRQQRVVYRLL